jgi:hypothetical protein
MDVYTKRAVVWLMRHAVDYICSYLVTFTLRFSSSVRLQFNNMKVPATCMVCREMSLVT